MSLTMQFQFDRFAGIPAVSQEWPATSLTSSRSVTDSVMTGKYSQ